MGKGEGEAQRITLSVVKAMQPGDVIQDDELKGFGVRRQRDAISYFIRKRVKGQLKRITIGQHGSPWTPEKARKRAASILQDIAAGGDPVAERRADKARGRPFGELADEFLKTHGTTVKPTTYAVYESLVRKQLKPQFDKRPMDGLSKADILKFHAAWSHQARTANHAVSVLSKIFAWAMDAGHLTTRENPCLGVKRFREVKRQRFLTMAELQTLGEVMQDMEHEGTLSLYVAAAIRLLMLTGARLSEILTLEWQFVDLERSLLFLPDSKTGEKVITLNSQAVALLKDLPRLANNPFVLPGQRHGQHLINIRLPWLEICKRAKVRNVRIHDLRHSFASVAGASGGSLPLIGKLLGHSQAQTTSRYVHVAGNPVTELAENTGRTIATALGLAAIPNQNDADKRG
jgi:integrase